MKNIHIIPTPKPNKLVSNLIEGMCSKDTMAVNSIKATWYVLKYQNIYITSKDEATKGDYIMHGGVVYKVAQTGLQFSGAYTMRVFEKDDSEGFAVVNPKLASKIVITSDEDLIKDGVQATPDGFLEWIAMNPTCDFVRIDKLLQKRHGVTWHVVPTQKTGNEADGIYRFYYMVILPKEEPKQFCENCKREISKWGCACGKQVEPKQETLEEVAERIANNTFLETESGYSFKHSLDEVQKILVVKSMIAMLKWQQQQNKNLYSKEDVKNLLIECCAEVSCEDGEPFGIRTMGVKDDDGLYMVRFDRFSLHKAETVSKAFELALVELIEFYLDEL